MVEVSNYNPKNTNADFDSDFVVEGLVLEILSLNTLLMIFKNSSIVILTTEALKPLLLLLNCYCSRYLLQKEECNPPQQSNPKFATPQLSTIGGSPFVIGHSRLCPSVVGLKRRQSLTYQATPNFVTPQQARPTRESAGRKGIMGLGL